MKKVAITELQSYERMVPLVGGYLEAYATKDPWLKSSYSFEKYTSTARASRTKMARDLLNMDADIYAFSCYVWNTKAAMSLLDDLFAARPGAQFVLGGPQVMHRAERYLKPEYRNVVVCNGEGEMTFSDYLRELTATQPDLSKIPGISFRSGGTMVTTPNRERVTSLDEIPSPFLAGLFKGEYGTTVLETNRGCPFHCAFCYWGAATNDRVHRFHEDRIKDEITWIGKRGIPFVFIADANWGMLGRDLEFSRHIAHCRQEYSAPSMVYYAAAKNKPDNVTEVNRIFRQSGIITSQPISLQTMDDETLRLIDRQNIKASAFMQVQERLNSLKISSYTELIWPLPGETLHSFSTGIAQLCRMGNSTVVVYPHQLLANTPMYKRREEFGLVTVSTDDGVGEAETVVSTSKVSHEEFDRGMKFFYSTFLLHNVRALRAVAAYLDLSGSGAYEKLFSDFVEFWPGVQDNPIVDFVEEALRTASYHDVFHYGRFMHSSLHEDRASFDRLVYEFISSHPCFSDPNVRFLYEVDRLMKPYVYSSTPVNPGPMPFEFLKFSKSGTHALLVTIPEEFRGLFVKTVLPSGAENDPAVGQYRIDHEQHQYPYMKSRGFEHNAGYCHGMMIRVDSMVPTCTAIPQAEVAMTGV